MTETFRLRVPDSLAEAVQNEYADRRESVVEQLESRNWDRQAAMLREQLEQAEADDERTQTARAALAILASETDWEA